MLDMQALLYLWSAVRPDFGMWAGFVAMHLCWPPECLCALRLQRTWLNLASTRITGVCC